MHVSFSTCDNNIHPDAHGLGGRSHHVVHPIVGLHAERQRGVGALGVDVNVILRKRISDMMESEGERDEVTYVGGWEKSRRHADVNGFQGKWCMCGRCHMFEKNLTCTHTCT